MDLTTLRVFTTVVAEGGVSPAARKLNRVQSSVSTRIQQLEATLGTELFVRRRRRLHLSPAGKRFLDYAERMLATWDEARAAVEDDTPRGALRVGTLESTAASRLPGLLARYHRRFPQVRVELTTGTTDALLAAVRERRIAAAFVADFTPEETLDGVAAFREELVLVTSRAHPPVTRPRDLRSETVVAFARGCAYRRRLHRWLATDAIVPGQVLELSSYHAIVACVAAGAGVALVPRSVLETMRRTNVAVHRLKPRARASTTWLVRRREPAAPGVLRLEDEVRRPARRQG